MLAVYADSINPDDPLTGLVVGDRPDPEVPEGWTVVTVKAARSTTTTCSRCGGWGCRPSGCP